MGILIRNGNILNKLKSVVLLILILAVTQLNAQDKQLTSLEKAVKYFSENKDPEGLLELASALKENPASKEALDLWINKGEKIYTAMDYKLSYYSPSSEADNINTQKLKEIRDKVKDELKASGMKVIRIYLVGDSTVQDYTIRSNYQTKYYPMSGWGESFQERLYNEDLKKIKKITDNADCAVVINKAKGGRSTRTYWEDGLWKTVYDKLEPGDMVLIQFGHNDSAKSYPDRYVDVPGFKDYLAKYIAQTREKKAIPVLITPVNRNYPWTGENKLANSHDEYPEAMRQVAKKYKVMLVDLSEMSLEHFSKMGRKYVGENYFIPQGIYPNYMNKSDNTHFQIKGASELSKMIYEDMVRLSDEFK